jgi:uncharacterized membrane protein
MVQLIVGLGLFLGVHSISMVADGWRNGVVARIGKPAWQGLYSVVAAVGLVLIVIGYAAARAEPAVLYVPPTWMRGASMLLMVPVFPLLLAAYLPGRIKTAAKHPMLAGVKLWAFAHLLANGALADVVLFGAFLAWAVADRISLKRRAPRPVPATPPSRWNDAIAVVGGLAVYVGIVLGGHAWLTGMPLVLR